MLVPVSTRSCGCITCGERRLHPLLRVLSCLAFAADPGRAPGRGQAARLPPPPTSSNTETPRHRQSPTHADQHAHQNTPPCTQLAAGAPTGFPALPSTCQALAKHLPLHCTSKHLPLHCTCQALATALATALPHCTPISRASMQPVALANHLPTTCQPTTCQPLATALPHCNHTRCTYV